MGSPRKSLGLLQRLYFRTTHLKHASEWFCLREANDWILNALALVSRGAGQFFRMGPSSSSPGSLRKVLDAEAKLATMALAAEFVLLWHTETCPALRQHFANQYRKMVGVDPAARFELAEGLERIAQTGQSTVADLLDDLNRTTLHPPSASATEADCP